MFETLFRFKSTAVRHRSGPLAAERERYLRHCAAGGAADLTQRFRARAILQIAQRLSPSDRECVDTRRLRSIIESVRPRPRQATAENLLRTTRPWFKFLGWWREVERPTAFVDELNEFERWMRDERT